MPLYSDETREHRETLIAARQRLAEVTAGLERAGIREETQEYLDANDAVIEAMTPLAWWQRLGTDAAAERRIHDRDDTDGY